MGKCFYDNKQISKTSLLELAHKESLTPLIHLLVQHAGFELPVRHHQHKIENDSKKSRKSKLLKNSTSGSVNSTRITKSRSKRSNSNK